MYLLSNYFPSKNTYVNIQRKYKITFFLLLEGTYSLFKAYSISQQSSVYPYLLAD